MITSDCGLIILLKRPEPGRVKTRLAAALGAATACAIYEFLIAETLRRLPAGTRIIIAYDPPEAREDLRKLCEPLVSDAEYRAQAAGDLGARLSDQFERAFRSGLRRVLAIGGDCPAIAPRHFELAWRALECNEVVIGPSADGGYYLIGTSAPRPFLFQDMPWSSNQLLERTLAAIANRELSCELLETLCDLDVLADLKMLPRPLQVKLRERLPQLAAYLP